MVYRIIVLIFIALTLYVLVYVAKKHGASVELDAQIETFT